MNHSAITNSNIAIPTNTRGNTPRAPKPIIMEFVEPIMVDIALKPIAAISLPMPPRISKIPRMVIPVGLHLILLNFV